MLTKIDTQLEEYDARVGNSLQMISCDPEGRIPVRDLQTALAVIKHKPDEDVVQNVIDKLDVDKDGYVELEHVLGLAREEGLGKSDPMPNTVDAYYLFLLRHRCGWRSTVYHWSGERDQRLTAAQGGYRTRVTTH
jgi:hypothetical protein